MLSIIYVSIVYAECLKLALMLSVVMSIVVAPLGMGQHTLHFYKWRPMFGRSENVNK
jgi:hypothetical protein